MNSKLLGATLATVALVTAVGAHAQSRRPARSAATAASSPSASQTPLNHGPPIAGLCIYSNSQALGTSSVGKAFSERMQQLQAQAAAEVSAQQTQLQTEEKALVAKRATLSQEQFAQQAQPLSAREQQLNQTADLRAKELRATAIHQQQRLATTIEPLVRTVYESHHCAVLLNGDSVMAANPAMDLTPEVVTALNSRMTTITFDRESAPAQ